MPSLIEGEARQAVKRAIPKSSNKIHAAGVARLYIAYPDKSRWTYTGLQGAVVLCNDLVGNTFWLKIVDISPAGRGVVWDQEVYDTFSYNQDRVFFHTFELEHCLAGLSFVDDKEAKQFKKKVDEREKNAHKNTRSKPFVNAAGEADESSMVNGKSHSRLGGLGRNLLHGHIHSPASHTNSPHSLPPRDASFNSSAPNSASKKGSALEDVDPSIIEELKKLGVSEDQLEDSADFIRMYIDQKQSQADTTDRRAKAAPPPPQPLTPEDTGNTSASRRGPPPAPPPARGTSTTTATTISTKIDNARPSSQHSDNEPSPARPFRVPPPIADAGKFAHDLDSSPPAGRRRADSSIQGTTAPAPPPPPRPPKTPLDEDTSAHVFAVPPPFSGQRKPVPPPSRSAAPPPPPSRNAGSSASNTSAPPPPPPREPAGAHAVPPASIAPPPLPPKTPNAPPAIAETPRSVPPPPPAAGRDPARAVPPPPPMPSRNNQAAPSVPLGDAPPPPPPPPPPPGGSAAVPPPPPPPPAPPGMAPATANAPPLPTASAGRDNLMADIRGGPKLKTVSDSEKRDRSAALVAGSGGDSGPAASSGAAANPAAADSGGLAGALASALAARKSKVSQSDDEDDKDDW